MDPPAVDLPAVAPPNRRTLPLPRQNRQRGRNMRQIEWALCITVGFVILTLLKLGPTLRSSVSMMQNHRIDTVEGHPKREEPVTLPPCKVANTHALQKSIFCFQKCQPAFNTTIEGMGLDPNEMINITTETGRRRSAHTGVYGKYRVHFPEEGVYLNITTPDGQKFAPRAITERLFRRIIAKLFRARILDASKNIINTGSWIGDNALPWALMMEQLSGNDYPPGKVIAVDPSTTFVQTMGNIANMNSIGNLCARIGIYSSVERTIHTASAEHMVVDTRKQKGSEVLNAVPLDSENIVNVTLLHLDVEGHETEVLAGARNLIMSSRPVIVTEGFAGLNHPSDKKIASFLESLGYMSDEIPEVCGDDLFCRNHIWWPNEDVKAAAMKVVGNELKREVVVSHISPSLTEPRTKKQSSVKLGGLTELESDVDAKFCGHNKWLESQISCKDRVSFLVDKHHMSWQQAKIDLLEQNCQCNLDRKSSMQFTGEAVNILPYRGSIHHEDQSKIPHTLIFVDTRYYNISQFPRLVRENIQNTIDVYSGHWNEPNISVWFLGDEQCQQVIKKQSSGSDLLLFYQTESFGAYKSDICRIAALNERGGYYFDNDMEVVEAMSISNATFIMPLYKDKENKIAASNTFIASTPRHVIFQEAIHSMIDYYKTGRRTSENNNVGPTTLWEGYEQAAAKYCGNASRGSGCNSTWSIFDLTQVNLDNQKELYPNVPRRKGWGCCCNFVIHNPTLKKIYFWSRFLGAGGSCRFRGGKTADDVD